MSWCRWSSMAWRCDLYIYESNDGIVTHCATRRRTPLNPDDPCPEYVIGKGVDEFVASAEAQSDWLRAEGERWHWTDVPEPWRGESYTDTDVADTLARLKEMKADGLVFPYELIDELEQECAA